MRYWVAVHWPPCDGEETKQLWLADGRQAEGVKLAAGEDHVIVYETRSGRRIELNPDDRCKCGKCGKGRGAVVSYGQLTDRFRDEFLEDPDSKPTLYANHTTIWWRWYAPIRITSPKGFFVSRRELLLSLHFNPDWTMRGFGKNSGLLLISRDQYQNIIGKIQV